MKYIYMVLLALLGLGLTVMGQSINVNAEEIVAEEPATTEVAEDAPTESEEKFDFGEWLEEHFDAQTITTITSVLTMLVVILRLIAYTKSLAKEKNITTEEVKNQVIDILETTNKESVEKSINDLIRPLENQIGSITPVLNAFAKILALSQENTAESRLAILELIQELGNVSANVVEKAKEEINSQVQEENKVQEEKIDVLNSIEKKNSTPAE